MQWGAVLALMGGLWFQFRQRDRDRDQIVVWRINVERDVKEINDRLNRHEVRDGRIYDRLESIDEKLKTEFMSLSERLVTMETKMEKANG